MANPEKTTRELTMDATFRALLPRMGEADLEALRRDIQERGMVYPILVDENDVVIDGHHRYIAARTSDPLVPYPVEVRAGLSDEEKRALARAVNLYRRHLTPDQRRPVLAQLRSEGYSTTQIAAMAGVDQSTVSRELSAYALAYPDNSPAESAAVSTTSPALVTGNDGKRYPATRAAPERVQERRQKVKALIDSGMTQRQVAKELGIAQSLVSNDWNAAKGDGEEGAVATTRQSTARKSSGEVKGSPGSELGKWARKHGSGIVVPKGEIAQKALLFMARWTPNVEIAEAYPARQLWRAMEPDMQAALEREVPVMLAFLHDLQSEIKRRQMRVVES